MTKILGAVALVAVLGTSSGPPAPGERLAVRRAAGPGDKRGSAPSTASAPGAREQPGTLQHRAWRDRFPNVVLRTHQGKEVRFYDDLIKGKIVAINFMYVACTGL